MPRHKISDMVWAKSGPRKAQNVRDTREPAPLAAPPLSPSPPPHTRARPLRAAACLCGNPPRERGGPGAEVAAALPAAFLQNAGNGAARCRRGLAGGRPGAARGRPATSRACAGPDPGLRTPFPSPSPLLPPPPPPPPHRLPLSSSLSPSAEPHSGRSGRSAAGGAPANQERGGAGMPDDVRAGPCRPDAAAAAG